MKQILQNLRSGKMELADLPAPAPGRGQVLIQTSASLISPGTERMLVEFSQANLIQKARRQPEKVRQVLDKMKTDGLVPTLEAVFRRLDEPLPLGYCNVGTVVELGEGVHDLAPGDRVASNGPHAQLVCVPRHLCAKVPDAVSDEAAAFTVLGSVALQGVRLAEPALGERFMVFGMGLLGLLTVQLLRASGCEVLAVDLNAERLARAEAFGAKCVHAGRGDDPVAAAEAWTQCAGVDGVLITASASGDAIVHQAARACRKRGRIILVGVVGLNLRRDDFYEKELSFQVSCSYGPGRYDEAYEQAGQDYPLPFVRWTEQRNFEAFLGALASGRVHVQEIVTHRFAFENALEAYEQIQENSSALGVLLNYSGRVDTARTIQVHQRVIAGRGEVGVGVIGAGAFAKGVLLPALAKTNADLLAIADLDGVAAEHAAEKFGFQRATTEYRTLLADESISAICILVGHHLHARLVIEALQAGKHVFVEKPLALNEQELLAVSQALEAAPDQMLMVGFNRRFSPHTLRARAALAGRCEPLTMTMTVNSGAIAPGHWTQDPERGGGRIIGEGCHFIDLLSFMAGSQVVGVSSVMVGEGASVRDDKTALLLRMADGSIGTVNYFSNGSKAYPKESLEIFSDGRVLKIENFRRTQGYGFSGFKKFKTFRQDKGHAAEVVAFIECIAHGGPPPIAFDALANATRASLAAVESARDSGRMIEVP